jgi:hypothetical protein
MRLYSYVVARDFGFAPNPFYGICTLATCKPAIRRTARIGDWVVGTGPVPRSRQGYLVYAMKVDEIVTFDEYWRDPRFADKKPNLHGSKKQAFGDNIYHRRDDGGPWFQEDSHHSLSNGEANSSNIGHDTRTPHVLIATNFAYFGGEGPEIPSEFRDFDGHDICAGHGHKSRFPRSLVESFISWFQSLGVTGYAGVPLDWSRTP